MWWLFGVLLICFCGIVYWHSTLGPMPWDDGFK